MTIPLTIGRYEPLHAIASGGMATVYLARARGARGFERHVALKVMHPHLAEDLDFVAMFLDEARMAANIRHPNVVSTLDVVEEDGQLFLVMEYVEGPSLQAITREMTKRNSTLPLDCTLRITLDVLAGLHAAHEQTLPDGSPMNMVHRDVSPHNVLVGIDGVARIMDFGVARAENRINHTIGANPKGKLPYMPPEQIASTPLDRRADVYSVGIVLWELLTGKGLFRADNDGALLLLAMHGATQSPSDVNPDVPPALSAVCMRALAMKPENRFPSAADFADALESAAKEAQIAIAARRVLGAFCKEIPPEKAPGSSVSSLHSGGAASPRAFRSTADANSVRSDSASASMPIPSGFSAPFLTQRSIDTFTLVSSTAEAPSVPSTGPTPLSMPSPMTSDSSPEERATVPAVGPRSRSRVIVAVAFTASLVLGLIVWLVVGGRGALPPGAAQQDALPETSSTTAKTSPTPAIDPVVMPATSTSAASSAQATPSASSAKGDDKAPTPSTKVSATRVGNKPPRTGTFRPEEP